MLAARWIITARHCADDLSLIAAGPGEVAVQVAGVLYKYQAGELSGLKEARPPNAVGEALSLDFALLPAPAALVNGPVAPDPILAAQLRGAELVFTGFEGKPRKCRVTFVCGAQVQIQCKEGDAPVEGDSGHVVFASRSGRPIGVLTGNGGVRSGVVAAYATIMGRSSALASAWNEARKPPRHVCDLASPDGRQCALSGEFAGSAHYRYPRDEGPLCRAAAAVHREVSVRRIRSDRLFTAVAGTDQGALLADVRSGSLCSLTRETGRVVSCIKLPPAFGRNVKAILRLGGGRFVVSQATTLRPPETVGEWSKVLLVASEPGTGKLSFGAPVLAPLRQITSAVDDGAGNVLVGGTGGICVLQGASCSPLIWHADNPRESDWIARGMLRLANGDILAVGRDYLDDGVAGGPSRRRVEIARCWVLGPTSIGFNYKRACGYDSNKVVERLSQLVAPTMIAGEPVAFSSSGEAVALTGGRIGRSIPFDGLMESRRPSAALDDVVRGVIDNEDDTLTIAASDGSVRVVEIGLTSSGKLDRLTAKDARTAFDLAIWIVGLTATNGWAIAVAQSGEAYELRWPAAASSNLSAAYVSTSTRRARW